MSSLSFGWNKFRKAPYVSQVLSNQSGAIFGKSNNEMINTMTSHVYIYIYISRSKNKREKNLRKMRIYTDGIRIGKKCVIDILECDCYIFEVDII